MRKGLLPMLAVGVLLAASACTPKDEPGSAGDGASHTKDGGEPADPKGAPEPKAAFTATVSVAGGRVRVDYLLSNEDDAPMLVPNLLPHTVGAGTRYDDPTAAYVVGDGTKGGVVVTQRVFAWPDSDRIDFGQAPSIGAQQVPPGANWGGRVDVPLTRNQPFGNDLGYGTIRLPDPVRRVTFCLGVLASPVPVGIYSPRPVDGVTVLSHGNLANGAQHLFCSEPYELN